jgi:integrase
MTQRHDLVESRMRRKAHVRFGGRAEETDEPQGTHRASARPDHTHAAILIAQGEHPKVIQHRLGHSSIKVTLDTYGHLFEGLDEAAAERLDAFLPRTPPRIDPTRRIARGLELSD